MERPKTTLYIVRHGETEANVKQLLQGHHDTPLTELGIFQAKKLAEDFKDIDFKAVFSSDLLRAKRTAEIVKLERDLEVKTTELLRERSFGQLEGRNRGQFRIELKELFEKFEKLTARERNEFKFHESVESFDLLMTRFMTALREISLAYPDNNVLVVTHGGVLRGFLGHLDEKYYGLKAANTGYAKVACDGVEFELLETRGIGEREEDKF